MKIFFYALIFRLSLFIALSLIYPNNNITIDRINSDPKEYYLLATNNLQVPPVHMEFSYKHWYERTPFYVLFLYLLTPKIALIIQMIAGSLGTMMMYKMNKGAGIAWNFYECWYDLIFLKESLMFAMIIAVIFKRFRKAHPKQMSYENYKRIFCNSDNL